MRDGNTGASDDAPSSDRDAQEYESNAPNSGQRTDFDQSTTSINAGYTLPPIPSKEREAGPGVNQGSMLETRKENVLCLM